MDTKPNINITPLIDVLLVLLIIFMVIAPTKSTNFKTKIPPPPQDSGLPNPLSLIVSLNQDLTLLLNNGGEFGSINEPKLLIEKLREIFNARTENFVYAENDLITNDLLSPREIQKTVFIRAPRTIGYGKVVKLIDAVKTAGGNPISLQIDNLN